MTLSLLKTSFFILALAACSSSKNNNQVKTQPDVTPDPQPEIAAGEKPRSMMELPQTQDGGFVLRPGFYEAEFKTYCLQPGTPDPRQGDAYLQGPVTGYRKEIVESILLNSRNQPQLQQKNIQLLLWSVVSGSDFNKLSYDVQRDARQLLTPKQVFELQGGVVGLVKTVSQSTGLLDANNDIKQLFDKSINTYEAYERLAVRSEQSRIVKQGVKYDQWYKQKENYYVRYFPEDYKKVRIQIYVPQDLLDNAHKLNNEYVVFDPTGQQAIPAFTNAQRLGVGSPALEILREVIIINKKQTPPVQKKPKKSERKDVLN